MKRLKTSEEWYNLQVNFIMLDPDEWDRKNFKYSWYEEKSLKLNLKNELRIVQYKGIQENQY